MKHLILSGILLIGCDLATSHDHDEILIPPENEAGSCTCQRLPVFLSGIDTVWMPKDHGVKFKLYKREIEGDAGVTIKTGDETTLLGSGFDPKLPVTVITHGWNRGTIDPFWVYRLKDGLLKKVEMNVVLVDWTSLSGENYYLTARYGRYTGLLLAEFLQFIQKTFPSFSAAQIHLIGYGLGAHVSGIAGNNFRGIARITALDPNAPSFECVVFSQRLDSIDATFVDVIYTNAGCLAVGNIGYRSPIGHQNFYVNGGGKQPGCNPSFRRSFFDVLSTREPYMCHHHRSIDYFLESIYAQPEELPYAFNCSDYEEFKTGACLTNQKAVFGYGAIPVGETIYGEPQIFFMSTQEKPAYLSKHIRIEVYLGHAGDTVANADFELIISGPIREEVMITLLWTDQTIQEEEPFVKMAVLPLGTDVGDLTFHLHYGSSRERLFTFSDLLDIKRIVVIDTSTDKTFCVLPRMSIKLSEDVSRIPTPGEC